MNNILEPIWAIACSSSIIDQQTNSVSLINVLERILVQEDLFKRADNKKIISFPIQVISLWRRLDKEPFKKISQIEARAELLDPEEKVVYAQNFNLTLEENKERLRHRLMFEGLPLTIPGIYRFKISLSKSQQVVYVPLRIKEVKELPRREIGKILAKK